MIARRVLWWLWITLSATWVGLLLLTGKYWCPFFFWRAGCTARETFNHTISLSGVPLMTLGAGVLIGCRRNPGPNFKLTHYRLFGSVSV
jgi:hypothetical protein